MSTRARTTTTGLLAALGMTLLAAAAQAADICEPLREQIEARIASNGVTGFAVVVVDADAPVAGKVVGTCAQGARKLVYVREGGNAGRGDAATGPARAAVPAPAARPGDPTIITECRDGPVVRGSASCKP